MYPTLSDFLAYVRKSAGKKFITESHRKPFTVEAVGQELFFIPESTGKSRKISPEKVSLVLAKFSDTGDFKPGTYQKITFHASYILAIVRFMKNTTD